MLAELKLFKRKKATVNQPQEQMFRKKYMKKTMPESLFNKAAGKQHFFFTGDCFSNLFELSMVFDPVKNFSENVQISQKTESKYQVT